MRLRKLTKVDSWDAGVLATTPDPPRFRVKIVEEGRFGLALGLAPRSTFQVEEDNVGKCGYYLFFNMTPNKYKRGPGENNWSNYANKEVRFCFHSQPP